MRSGSKTVESPAKERHRSPVFVLGSPRSGTTLLYSMLLSAGGFAVYLAESNVFNLLGPRFGDLRSRANRKRLLDAWLNSKLFLCSGLDAGHVRRRILEECQNGGDFLRIVMGEICELQGKQRWAERIAREWNIRLDGCAFYSDSYSDRGLMERVGRPVAANPDWRLRTLARRRGWEIVAFG